MGLSSKRQREESRDASLAIAHSDEPSEIGSEGTCLAYEPSNRW